MSLPASLVRRRDSMRRLLDAAWAAALPGRSAKQAVQHPHASGRGSSGNVSCSLVAARLLRGFRPQHSSAIVDGGHVVRW